MLQGITSRRSLLLTAAVAAAGNSLMTAGVAPAQETNISEFVVEKQRSDPRAKSEEIKFDPFAVQALVGQTKASFRPRNKAFADNLAATAKTFVGVNRVNNREKVSNFLELFNLPFEVGSKPLPFCAAGLSYAAALSYLNFWNQKIDESNQLSLLRGALSELDRYHFYPSPSVVDMYFVARGKRRWIDRLASSTPKAGWLVIYDWSKNGDHDHVGIVESVSGANLRTIEFNTTSEDQKNGGAVERRTRKLDETVSGFIRTDISTFV